MHRSWIGIVLVIGACRETTPPAPPVKEVPTRRAPIAAAIRPSLPPTLPSVVVAWSVAESRDTAEDWERAAEAYERELEHCADDCTEVVYATILARRNAMLAEPMTPPEGDQPVPVPPRVQALVDALDHYAAIGDPSDPDVAGVKFLAANHLNKWRQPDAIARYETVLRDHATAEVAEYSANLLLHTLMKQQRFAEMRVWVDRMLADAAFLAGKPDLEATLRRIKNQIAAAP